MSGKDRRKLKNFSMRRHMYPVRIVDSSTEYDPSINFRQYPTILEEYQPHSAVLSSSSTDSIIVMKPETDNENHYQINQSLPQTVISEVSESKIIDKVMKHDTQVYKWRCCKNAHNVDEYQCFNCVNGRCCVPFRCLTAMWSCPLWVWSILLFSFIALNGLLIYFMATSQVVNPSYQLYKYIYEIYNYTIYNYGQTYNIIYCISNATNPCLVTSTMTLTANYQVSNLNIVTSTNISSVQCHPHFIIYLFLTYFIIFLTNI